MKEKNEMENDLAQRVTEEETGTREQIDMAELWKTTVFGAFGMMYLLFVWPFLYTVVCLLWLVSFGRIGGTPLKWLLKYGWFSPSVKEEGGK